MATILELVAAGALVRIDPDLDPEDLEERCIYVFPHVTGQIDRLIGKPSLTGQELLPLEQLFEFFAHFASGGTLHIPRQFHDLKHRENGIWELKTADLRLFGWFYAVDCFICTDVADATFVKHGPPGHGMHGSLYHGYGSQVAMRRNQIDLDEPKYVDGEDPANVISNFTSW